MQHALLSFPDRKTGLVTHDLTRTFSLFDKLKEILIGPRPVSRNTDITKFSILGFDATNSHLLFDNWTFLPDNMSSGKIQHNQGNEDISQSLPNSQLEQKRHEVHDREEKKGFTVIKLIATNAFVDHICWPCCLKLKEFGLNSLVLASLLLLPPKIPLHNKISQEKVQQNSNTISANEEKNQMA